MADGTPIEWTHRPGTRGETWNPVAGCDIVSPGCTHCYAMRQARRIELMAAAAGRPTHYAGTTKLVKDRPVWTGKIAVAPDHVLTKPLRWREPRTVFVNSMSDLFHEAVPDAVIDRVFGVMALCPQHTFIVLTKRASRMRLYFVGRRMAFGRASDVLHEEICHGLEEDATQAAHDWLDLFDSAGRPQPNVWLGVSTEDQARYDERAPDLRATPAAVKFFSMEPLLGPIAAGWLGDWVIVGGESGPGPRPMHPAWARAIRDQCAAAGVPFFFKQWGAWKPISQMVDGESDGLYHPPPARDPEAIRRCKVANTIMHHDGSRHDDPRDTRAFAAGTGSMTLFEVGKSRAGRTLDGVEHDAFPPPHKGAPHG